MNIILFLSEVFLSTEISHRIWTSSRFMHDSRHMSVCTCGPCPGTSSQPPQTCWSKQLPRLVSWLHSASCSVSYKFNALVVSTAHKRLFSHLQIQLLQRCFCQQTPGRACTVRTDWIFRKYRQIPKDWNFPQKTSNPVTEITRHMVYDALPLIQLFVWCISICISFDLNKEQTASKICT